MDSFNAAEIAYAMQSALGKVLGDGEIGDIETAGSFEMGTPEIGIILSFSYQFCTSHLMSPKV